MKEQLISFKTAKLAKEKGFDEPCYDCYNPHGMQFSNGWCEYIHDNDIEIPFDNKGIKEKDVLAPTQSLLQKWLREKHKIAVMIFLGVGAKYGYTINNLSAMDIFEDVRTRSYHNPDFDSYENALEEGLLNTLKLIS